MEDESDQHDVINQILQQTDAGKGRQKQYLRSLVTAMVMSHRPMTAQELAEMPNLRGMSMSTLYRLIA
ncbi:hypothetical protein GCM10023213_28270 [Prosthecobacter algae]|uniref:IclR-like helix-turn-helix domain-containing protein n=1 Tax=Prosthecobacter algae TaxID=1144682 RepID=A0ABP9PA26_9BACT